MKKLILLSIAFVLFSCKERNHNHHNEFTTSTGKTIIVSEKHNHSTNLVAIKIQTSGFEHEATFDLNDIDPISFYEVYDLDGNGYDEIYIITKSQGPEKYSSIIAYASNKDKSLTPIHFPELNNADLNQGGLFEGYKGHDNYSFSGNSLIRTFPIYSGEDTNTTMREIRYQLVQGEASWRLKISE